MNIDSTDTQEIYSPDSCCDNQLSARQDLFQQALHQHQQGEDEQALWLYQQVIDSDPDHAEAFFYGALLYEDAGQHDKALPWLQKAHELQPALPAVAYKLGVCQYTLGENQQAIESFEKVVAVDVDNWEAAYNLGAAYYASGQFFDAINAYSSAAQLNAQDGDIFFNLALSYKKIGNLEKARAAYIRAMQLMPEDADVYYNLGKLYEKMGEMEDAITTFELATALRPDFGAALTNLGVLYCCSELYDKAIPVYENLVAIGHNPLSAQHILDGLRGKVTEAPPLDYVKDLFDGFADHFENKVVGDLGYDLPSKLVGFLTESSGCPNSFERMLDLGCGTGLCGEVFNPLALSMTGVDLSAKMLERASQKTIYDQLVEDDIVSYLDSGAAPYDLIVAADVLIYLGDLEPLLKQLTRNLTKFGRIVFSTEHFDGEDYTLLPLGRYAHSTSYVTRLARENGLQVLAVDLVKARKEKGRWVTGELYLLGHA